MLPGETYPPVENNTGLLPEADVQSLREYFNAIKERFAAPAAKASGKGLPLEIKLPGMQPFNQPVLQEDSSKGQRVKRFTVEARINGRWKQIAGGSPIGHKYIGLLEKPVKTMRIRLRIEVAFAEPSITNFAIYNIGPRSF